jgi:antigen flippase
MSPTQENQAATAVLDAPAPQEKGTHVQILKSTALVGGSSVVNIAMGIVRTKAMAMLLGPAGFGLAGLYMSVATLTQSIAGMGINSSGVRQIAEATGSGESERVARTATVLRRTSLVLGLLGVILLVLFSKQVSTLTFGSNGHAGAIGLLSLAVFLNLVSAGQSALIQGLRRIADLARMSVLGSLFGTLITIPIIYFFREAGVVPSLIGVAAMTLLTSWWFSRNVGIQTPSLTASHVRHEANALLKLGFAFMASGLLTMGSAYLVRVLLVHKLGLEATGLYQAAWTLGGLYVGIILQSMGADFYPRLTACATDNKKVNRMVNEQASVSLLLAGPGMLATLAFAPLVISMFYAPKFGPAVGILRWVCLGIALRAISWPMGFIIVAKGAQTLYLLSELAWTVVHLGLAWTLLEGFGLNGTGMAFFGSYVFHVVLIYSIVSRLSGFRWSDSNKKTIFIYVALIGTVFCSSLVLPMRWATIFGGVVAVLSAVNSVSVLLRLVPEEQIPARLRGLAASLNSLRLRFVPVN